jgi:hypothetical protein
MAHLPKTLTHSSFHPKCMCRLYNDASFSSDYVAWNEGMITKVTGMWLCSDITQLPRTYIEVLGKTTKHLSENPLCGWKL